MLSGMRAFARSKWAIVLLALLVLALGVGVGISNPFTGVTGGGFVQAGEHNFGTRDANRYLNQYIENVNLETGESIRPEQAAREGVTNQIIGVLVQRASSLAFSDKIGVKASPTAVAKIFAESPRFRDALGLIQLSQIDSFAYNESFRDRSELEAFQRDEVTMGYLEQAALAGLETPGVLVDPLVDWVGERRRIAYARLSEASVPEVAEPTDEELVGFFDERKAMFEQPERRAVSGILYSPDDFVDPEPITDEMVASAYEARIRTYTTGEKRELVEITADSTAVVQTVVDLIKQGGEIDAAVSQVSGAVAARRTVGMSDIANEDYAGLVFGLPPGEVAGPFPVDEVPTAVMVVSIEAGVVQPLEEVAEALRLELAEQDARRAFNASSEIFYDLVGAGVPLEEISDELGVPLFSFIPVDRGGNSEAYGSNPTFAAFPDVLAELFQIQAGESTDVVEGDDTRAIFRVDLVVEPRTPDFEEVREDLAPLYRSVRVSEAANAVVDDAVSRINAGEDFAAVAREVEMIVAEPDAFANRPMDPNRPNPLLTTAFSLEAGQAGVARDAQAGPLIVVVREIETIDPEQRDTAEQQVRQLIAESLQRDIQQTYWFALESEVEVKTNANAINEYLNSYLEVAQ